MIETNTILDDLVLANRILANEGVLDAFGHVSLRDPENPGHFLIPRSLGPELATTADLQTWTVADNQSVSGHPGRPYAERAIHAAIYAARPDVQVVCHNHAPSAIPFSVTGVPLRPIFHMGGLLGTDIPVWEPSDDFGATDMLVRSLEQGASLARTLGQRRFALMRGHGCVVAGTTLKEVVFASVYLEHNARVQLQAIALGQAAGVPVHYLSDDEIAAAQAGWLSQPLSQDRAWDTWAERVRNRPTAAS